MWKKNERNVRMFHGSEASTQFVNHVVTDNGVTKVKTVSVSLADRYKELPDKKNFDLDAQLKAGVKLQEVQTNLLSPDEPNLSQIPNEPIKHIPNEPIKPIAEEPTAE